MSNSREQAQFRAHLSEMRHAAGGLGRDFAHEFSDLDRKIERMGTATAKEAKYLGLEIQDDLSRLGKAMDTEMRRIPQRLSDAGSAISSGTLRAAGAARDAVVAAGKAAKSGTQNAFAAAAGVKRTPMREWSPPATGDAPPPPDQP
jgi:acetoin utilization deacetylase AcuC-like enzyme